MNGANGQTRWVYKHGINGKDDVINAVAELPGGDLLLAGYQTIGNVAKRSLVRVSPSERRVVWTATDFGDAQGSHGAWEMVRTSLTRLLTHSLSVARLPTRSLAHSLAQVDVTADSVLLSGGRGRRSKQEMFFKSYGNVPEGNAVVMEIPFSALGSAPTAASATWEERWNGNTFEFITAKAARPGPDGGVLVLLWGEEASGSLQLFDAQRRSVWGPTKYGETHGEATDVAVSRDGGSAGSSAAADGGSSPGTSIQRASLTDGVRGAVMS